MAEAKRSAQVERAERARQLVADQHAQQTKGKTAEDLRREIEEDYGQWVAVENIYHGTALAYAVGHPVPHTNVQLHGYDKTGQVKHVDQVLAELEGEAIPPKPAGAGIKAKAGDSGA